MWALLWMILECDNNKTDFVDAFDLVCDESTLCKDQQISCLDLHVGLFGLRDDRRHGRCELRPEMRENQRIV